MAIKKDKSPLTGGVADSILKTKCAQCDELFKESDNLSIQDGKVFHDHCVPVYINQKDIDQLQTEFTYLTEADIDTILSTDGQSGFQVIRDNPWIVLIRLNSQECSVSGFADQTAVEAFIVTHYQEEGAGSEQGASIEKIFNNGTEYSYDVDITASVSVAS